MAKSTSLAELQPRPTAERQARKPRKATATNIAGRAAALVAELSSLPMKPLLIGAGIGAALVGSALAVSGKRGSARVMLGTMNPALTKTALVALARVVSGQSVRNVATSALLDVADAMKKP